MVERILSGRFCPLTAPFPFRRPPAPAPLTLKSVFGPLRSVFRSTHAPLTCSVCGATQPCVARILLLRMKYRNPDIEENVPSDALPCSTCIYWHWRRDLQQYSRFVSWLLQFHSACYSDRKTSTRCTGRRMTAPESCACIGVPNLRQIAANALPCHVARVISKMGIVNSSGSRQRSFM